jgi:hypothetical protein
LTIPEYWLHIQHVRVKKQFKYLNVIHHVNRETLDIIIDKAEKSRSVVLGKGKLMELRGKPKGLKVGSGPEFFSIILDD